MDIKCRFNMGITSEYNIMIVDITFEYPGPRFAWGWRWGFASLIFR